MRNVYRLIAVAVLVLLVASLFARFVLLSPQGQPSPNPEPASSVLLTSGTPASTELTPAVQVVFITATPVPTRLPPIVAKLEQQLGKGRILNLRYSPDGRLIAVLSMAGTYLYEARTLRQVGFLQRQLPIRPEIAVYTSDAYVPEVIAFSPDSRLLAVMEGSGLMLWDVATQQLARSVRIGMPVGDVAFSPDGRFLALAGSYSPEPPILILPVDGDQPSHALQGHKEAINDIAFSKDGQWLASASSDKRVLLWSAQRAEQAPLTIATSTASFRQVEFSDDSRLIVVLDDQGVVLVNKVPGGEEVGRFRYTDSDRYPSGFLLSHRSGEIYLLLQHSLNRRRITGEAATANLETPRKIVGAQIAPDETELAVALENSEVLFYKLPLETGQEPSMPARSLSDHRSERVVNAAPLGTGDTAAVFFEDGSYEVKKLPAGEPVASGRIDPFPYGTHHIRVARDKPLAVPESGMGRVQVWHLLNKEVVFSPPNSDSVAVDLSSDGQLVAAKHKEDKEEMFLRESFVAIWRIGDNIPVHRWKVSDDFLIAIALSPDGAMLASLSWDNFTVWRIADQSTVFTLKKNQDVDPHSELHFSPDGEWLFALSKDLRPPLHKFGPAEIRLVSRGGERFEPRSEFGGDWGRAVQFAPSRKWAAIASYNDILMFNLEDVQQRTTISTGYPAEIKALLFTADEQQLISVHSDGTWLIWRLAYAR
ncbi:MAG: WD40 repeat domain-containing protein [Thermoflexales bacterium]|nr:WD40 repeat domain-containing protein [Thermoflexales bacterium]